MQKFVNRFETLRGIGKELGPYVLLEVLMPGGTLLALLLFLYQRGKLNAGGLALRIMPARTR